MIALCLVSALVGATIGSFVVNASIQSSRTVWIITVGFGLLTLGTTAGFLLATAGVVP